MATSKIPAQHKVETLYTNTTYRNDIGKTLTLSDDISEYESLRVAVYGTTIGGTHRSFISINLGHISSISGQFPISCNAVLGAVRLSFASNKLQVLSSSYSALCVGEVVGMK